MSSQSDPLNIGEKNDSQTSRKRACIRYSSCTGTLQKYSEEFKHEFIEYREISNQNGKLWCVACSKPINAELCKIKRHIEQKKHQKLLLKSNMLTMKMILILFNFRNRGKIVAQNY
jgi:hypothetical protein